MYQETDAYTERMNAIGQMLDGGCTLSSRARFILIMLAAEASDDLETVATLETLGKWTGIRTRTTLLKYISELENEGYIQVTRRTSLGNIYRINMGVA